MKFRTGAAFLAAAAISLSIGPGSWAAGETLFVDDLRDDCPEAEFTAIQDAVDAAIERDIKAIRVCEGSYLESVTVPAAATGLTIRGPGDPADYRTTCRAERVADPLVDAVVTGSQGFGIRVEADGVTVQGMTVAGTLGGPGIRTSATAAGYVIDDNFLTGNQRGLDFRTSGAARSFVFTNCLIANNATAVQGKSDDPSGVGILGVGVFNTWIQQNVTRLHASKAMDFNQSRSFVAKLNRAFSDGAIELRNSHDVWLQQNKSVDAAAPEAFRVEASIRIRFEHNNVHGASGDGILLTSGPNDAPISGLNIKLNVVQDATGNGLTVYAPGASKDITLQGNRMHRNAGHGLEIFSGDTAKKVNLIRNRTYYSGTYDCFDAGGPNKWTDNIGKTENKPGICSRT